MNCAVIDIKIIAKLKFSRRSRYISINGAYTEGGLVGKKKQFTFVT